MINLWMPIYNLVCKRATVMLFSFFDWFNILPPFTYEKVEIMLKIGTILIEHNNYNNQRRKNKWENQKLKINII